MARCSVDGIPREGQGITFEISVSKCIKKLRRSVWLDGTRAQKRFFLSAYRVFNWYLTNKLRIGHAEETRPSA